MSDKPSFSTTDLLHAIRQIPQAMITSTEKYLLTILLSCVNGDNEMWYSMDKIKEFSGLSRTSVKRYINTLEQKRFILIQKPTHYTHKLTNTYRLNIELIMSFHLTKSGSPNNPDVKVGVKIRPPLGSPDDQSRGRQTTTKKDIKERHRERAHKTRSALSVFEPSEQNQFLAQDLRLDLAAELESFKHRHKGDKNQYEFERWLKNSHAYRNRQPMSSKPMNEVMPQRSTVREMPQVIRTPQSDAIREKAMQEMRGFLRKTIVTGK